MRKWLTYIGLILFLVGVIFLFAFAQNRYESHRVNKVSIDFSGNEKHFLNDEMVNKLLIQNEGNPLNQLNSSINLHLIEERVRKNEMVENADAFLNPDGHLHIKIKQRLPVARIITATKSYYLDDRGLPMPLSSNFTERVPLVTGIYNVGMEKELFQLVDAFRKDDFFNKQIIGINRQINGDFQLNTRIGDYVIVFGKVDDIEEKMKKLKVFYKKMWNDEKLKKYNTLNLKYKNQVVCSY